MYHYVRPLAGSNIKGLDVADFDGQLDYLQRHYTMIGVPELLDALDGNKPLPPRSALLTFDDGIIDHYAHVFPRLKSRNLQGAFFPPATVVLERTLLDVHRVHYILASDARADDLASLVDRACDAHRSEHDLETTAYYRKTYAIPSRWDSAEVVYVKRMLQHALPEKLRNEIATALFARYVSADEKSFANDFYVSVGQLREMIAAGMHIGSHGETHQWLSRLDPAAQAAEMAGSLRLLRDLCCDKNSYTICYPYGDHDARTIEIARAEGFRAGFCTKLGLADVMEANRYALSRLDTNDLPKAGDVTPVDWTFRASTTATS